MAEEESGNCKICGVSIGGHNIYLHERMCDECFFKTFFPEPDEEKLRKEIEAGKASMNGDLLEFLGKDQTFFEKRLGLGKYFEFIAEAKKANSIILRFLAESKPKRLVVFRLYDGSVIGAAKNDTKSMDGDFLLKHQAIEEDDIYFSFAISDLESFFVVFSEEGNFLSTKEEMVEFLERLLKESKIEYFLEDTKDYKKNGQYYR